MKGMYASGGARAVLAEFAEDKQGHFGLTDANAATKLVCVDMCMEKGFDKDVDFLFKGKSACGIALDMAIESRLVAAVLGSGVAAAMTALWNRGMR